MVELKHIDFKKGSFEANGRTYYIEGALSVERFCEFQILEKEFAFNTSFKGLYDNLLKLREHMNKIRFVDAGVLLDNMIKGVTELEFREPKMLRLCALFCNTADEDRDQITEDLITRKVEDFRASGIDINDFFNLASATVPNYINIYEMVTRTISGQKDGKAEASQSVKSKQVADR